MSHLVSIFHHVVCDQTFFTELMKEASDIAICFNLRARHLLHLHVATGIQRYLLQFRQCFKNDQQAMVEEGRMLIEYATMNAVAIRKILKKYDKVCTRLVKIYYLHYLGRYHSVSGNDFLCFKSSTAGTLL